MDYRDKFKTENCQVPERQGSFGENLGDNGICDEFQIKPQNNQ